MIFKTDDGAKLRKKSHCHKPRRLFLHVSAEKTGQRAMQVAENAYICTDTGPTPPVAAPASFMAHAAAPSKRTIIKTVNYEP
ncbi:MAG: hypothetical protein IJ928_12930 [Prevotella sp.]|nr:hypothetical protein [Prevotella sp.]